MSATVEGVGGSALDVSGGGGGCGGRVGGGGGVGARIRRRHSANSGLLGKMDGGGGSDGGDEGKRERECERGGID